MALGLKTALELPETLGVAALVKGVGVPPFGFLFLVDSDGYYLTDNDGRYLIEVI